MVEQKREELDSVFHALADPTRRAMIQRLSEGDRSVGDLAAPFRMSFAGASKHVRVLEQAGLVQRTVKGRTHVCRLNPVPLAEADAWLRRVERFWSLRLDRLAVVLEEDKKEENHGNGDNG